MFKTNGFIKKVYDVFFLLMILFIVVYTLLFTDVFKKNAKDRLKDYSDGWTLSTGEEISLDDLKKNPKNEVTVIEKQLPSKIGANDSLCFQSKNVNITVWFDNEKVYSFQTKQNLTGLGYGFTMHEIGLLEKYAGATIRIRYESVYPNYIGVYVWNACICRGSDYVRALTLESTFLMVISFLVFFIGIVLVVFWEVMPDKSILPFDTIAFGIMSVILGVWSMVDTGVPALFTGHLFADRGLDRTLLLLAMYPLFLFIHSLTEKKRAIYRDITFFTVAATFITIMVLRFAFGKDLIRSFVYGMLVQMAIIISVILVMTIEDTFACRKENKRTRIRELLPGSLIMAVCFVMEAIFYHFRLNPPGRYFGFVRIGMVAFIAYVFILFLRWWSIDRSVMEQDSFVNKALQFSVSSESPEESIRLLLEYLGEEFKANRVCVFEKRKDGRYEKTGQWSRNSFDYQQVNSPTIPAYTLFEHIGPNNRYMFINNIENCRESFPDIAKAMEDREISRVISGVLEEGETSEGILEIHDIPEEILPDIEGIMRGLSHFLVRFIQQRKEQERILYYSYHDTLTEAKNQIAYNENTQRSMNMAQAFGYMLCEMVSGDEIDSFEESLKKVANNLIGIFGEDNVYRIEENLFVAFGFEPDETFFKNDVERAKKAVEDEQYTCLFGAVYCANGTGSLDTIRKKTTELMEEERDTKVEN